jgi:predicted O-linked N-acetylglucosamine transferase (SPINDLY family)
MWMRILHKTGPESTLWLHYPAVTTANVDYAMTVAANLRAQAEALGISGNRYCICPIHFLAVAVHGVKGQ